MNKDTIKTSFLQTLKCIVCPKGYRLKNILQLGSCICFQLHSRYKRRPFLFAVPCHHIVIAPIHVRYRICPFVDIR